MRTLAEIDRSARGLERAVLSWSLTGGDRVPVVLDRTIASVAGIRRWLAEVPGARRDLVRDYLVTTAMTVCGRDLEIEDVPVDVDEVERWLSSNPRRGASLCRPRTFALSFAIDAGQGLVSGIRSFALGAIPALAEAEEFEDEDDEWTFAMVVDQDELRLDVSDQKLTLTFTADPADVERECDRLYLAFADYWATVFAVAYDIDGADSVRYMLRGFDGGLPRHFFHGRELANQAGAIELVGSDPPAFRAPATRAVTAALGLSPTWPHVDIG
ncbi:MAG: hypothetical protein ACXVEF_01825 [Polyangiales bacterium]